MNTKTRIFTISLCILSTILYAQIKDNGDLVVHINNIKSSEGKLRVGLYKNEENWLDVPFKGRLGKIINRTSKVVFENLPHGEYAISLYHDKNDNGELDMIMGFIPKEPIACSNQAPTTFGPPKWDDARFNLNTSNKIMNIKL